MTTEKQLLANLQNAQLSTGPTTANGKITISTNAIKHGVFTKDLFLSPEIESKEDYQDILNNLIECLSPCNQIESLLVEKIAIDFWRLRRTIRFETGSIVQGIKSLLNQSYSHGKHNNEKIDEKIQNKNQLIAWNLSYIQCLTEGKVAFDKPKWENDHMTSDVADDFYIIAKSIPSLTKQEREILYNSYDLEFEILRDLVAKYGFSETNAISAKLIGLYSQQNQSLEKEIQALSKEKLINDQSDQLTYMVGIIPPTDNTEKVLKYERSLQKSIYQNLIMLKKLQGMF